MTSHHHWAIIIDGGKSVFYPVAHGMFVNAEQSGDFFYSVTAMDFNEPVILVSLPHYQFTPQVCREGVAGWYL